MATFEYNNKSFYMDDRLDFDLRKKIYPDLQKSDKDCVFLVDGKEGSGKSKFADILGVHASLYLNKPYDLNNMTLTPEEFRTRIQDCPKNTVVIYDEAHRGMGSRRALSEINNILVDLMMEMRQKNLLVIIVMPTFFMLDRYAALFRSRGLFHVYENQRRRGFWVYFNEKNKQELYLKGKKMLDYNVIKWPHYRGRFYNQYAVDENEYRAKKLKAFRDKPRITKSEKFKDQRDKIIQLYADDFEGTKAEFVKWLRENKIDLKKTQIYDIISGKFTEDDWKAAAKDGFAVEKTDLASDSEEKNETITFNKEEIDDSDGGEGDNEEI